MLFSKKYQISIEIPCHQSWEGMTPAEKGSFCSSCNKVVTDFTNLSEKQINEVMRANPVEACGRFTKNQLDKIYTLQPELKLSIHRKFFRVVTAFFVGIKVMPAQTDTIPLNTLDTSRISLDKSAILPINDSIVLADDSTCSDSISLVINSTLKFVPEDWVLPR